MFAIFKIVGVSPQALGRLHGLVKSDSFRTKRGISRRVHYEGEERIGHHHYVTIMDSKCNTETDTYTVTLRVNLSFECLDLNPTREYRVYPPLGIFEQLLKAVDPNLVPEEEVTVTVGNAEGGQIEEKRRALIETLFNEFQHLCGSSKECPFEVTSIQTGEVIVHVNRMMTPTLLRRVFENAANLEFTGQDEEFAPAFRSAKERMSALG